MAASRRAKATTSMAAATIVLRMLLTLGFLGSTATTTNNIGINYGQLGNNLPTPARARELVQSTTITKVKIYDTNPAIIEAFANTGIQLIVMVRNEDIQSLLNAKVAAKWVAENVACYLPATQITTILVGNEILQGAGGTSDAKLGGWLVPAMVNIHGALQRLNLDSQIKVSTPHSMAVLTSSFPPSTGAFRPELVDHIMRPMLHFLSSTGAPFMVNTYPFFAYMSNPLNISLAYAIFLPNKGVYDSATHLHYYNLMDAQVDAVYAAMAKLGCQNVDIVISETGWPSAGDPAEFGVSINNAMVYNRNLIKHVTSAGTPMRPNKLMDTYIFSLFNENLKPGPSTERNFGLFQPDMSLVYDVGILKTGSAHPQPTVPVMPPPVPTVGMLPPPAPTVGMLPPPAPTVSMLPPPPYPFTVPMGSPPPVPVSVPVFATPPPLSGGGGGNSGGGSPPSDGSSGGSGGGGSGGGGTRIWCISKPGVEEEQLFAGLNFACGEGGADCSAIQSGGSCYSPNTLESHASFAFNSYFHKHGRNFWNCYFNNNALLTVSDPSYGACIYTSQ